MTKIGTLFLLAFLATTCSAQLLRSGLDPQLARRLNANTDLINRVIKLLLPVANTQLQALIKDPVDIPVEESFSAGKTQAAGDCQAGEDITATLVLGALSGQNSTEITSLTVREGTEEVSCGCCPTTFSGTFDIVLSADSYTVDGSVSLTTTDTTNCPTAESDIAVTVYNPTFNGAVEISGEIRGDDATIKSVNITEFKVTCDSVNTTYSPPLPDSLQDATQFVNDNVSTFVKEFLSGEYIETFRGWVEAALNGLSRAWSYLTGVTWLARFARANAATSVTNFLKFGFGLGN